MTPLCSLARKWHSDKVDHHSYTPFYHALLSAYQTRTPVRKVLEIGIGYNGLMHPDYKSGASLFMWRDYFPYADIYGLDIREDALVNEERIHSFQCDQSRTSSLIKAAAHLGTGFDLIVDDGSHEPEDQLRTAIALVGLLREGGYYVVEDVRSPANEQWNIFPNMENVDLETIRLYDDRLIVIRR